MRRRARTDGFSIVELLVALVILTVGVLALGTVTGYLILQVKVADTRTERAAALQQGVEEVRALPFPQITTIEEGSARSYGEYLVWWRVAQQTDIKKELVFYTSGPGFVAGSGLVPARADSFPITLARMN